MIQHIDLHREKIAAFCKRWGIQELALFGSVLRDDFSPDSDVDILITVPENRRLKLADLLQMQAELEDILGREVDLGTRRSVEEDENYLRRQAILESAQVIYAE